MSCTVHRCSIGVGLEPAHREVGVGVLGLYQRVSNDCGTLCRSQTPPLSIMGLRTDCTAFGTHVLSVPLLLRTRTAATRYIFVHLLKLNQKEVQPHDTYIRTNYSTIVVG
jgi:hypothetical protein